MGSSYGGASFDVIPEGTVYGPEWTRESNVAVRHIPYGTKDDVQFGTIGNERLHLNARIASLTTLNTLKSARDGTARTFNFEGTAFANTYLTNVGRERRFGVSSAIFYEAELEFTRVST